MKRPMPVLHRPSARGSLFTQYTCHGQPAPPIDHIDQSGKPLTGEYETTYTSESHRENNR